MPIKFCAQCAAELTLQIESGRERPVCPKCGYVVYRNPAPVGLVIATRGDQLLLTHRKNPPLANYWAPPAGHIEIDESVEEGTVRETKEETGLNVTIDRFVKLYSRANMTVTIAAFTGRVIGGEIAVEEHEVIAVEFFSRDALPVQPPPVNGTPMDHWFYELVTEFFANYRAGKY